VGFVFCAGSRLVGGVGGGFHRQSVRRRSRFLGWLLGMMLAVLLSKGQTPATTTIWDVVCVVQTAYPQVQWC